MKLALAGTALSKLRSCVHSILYEHVCKSKYEPHCATLLSCHAAQVDLGGRAPCKKLVRHDPSKVRGAKPARTAASLRSADSGRKTRKRDPQRIITSQGTSASSEQLLRQLKGEQGQDSRKYAASPDAGGTAVARGARAHIFSSSS
eukprot:4871299-Pleurochrysis_carterae.AAC.3